MKECKTARFIAEVAARHPHFSYDTINRRFKRFRMGDSTATADRRGSPLRIFSNEQESTLAAVLRAKRDVDNIILNRPIIIAEAAEFFRKIHGDKARRSNGREFSKGWAEGFKERNGFSTKKLVKKETIKSITVPEMFVELEAFKFIVREAVKFYGAHFVFNMDETPFPLADTAETSWGDKGSDQPNVSLTIERKKKLITAMPTVSASGTKLKFAWINKGKTDLAIRRAGISPDICSFYSEKGWTNGEIMCKYIEQIIYPHTKGAACALLVDSYAAHWTADAQEVAKNHNVDLIMVPKGQTGKLQPLDISFNSIFKQQRHKLYSEGLRSGSPNLEELGSVMERTAAAFGLVSREVILSGWNTILNDP